MTPWLPTSRARARRTLPADRGAPTVFCAGNDIGDFLQAAMSAARLGTDPPILYGLARCETPLVAAVQGNAVGVGTTMLMHCDHVIASTKRGSDTLRQSGC